MLTHPLLASLTPEHRRAVVAHCPVRVIKRGELVLGLGQESDSLLAIQSGIVRVELPAREGPACCGFLTAGDLIVERIGAARWISEAAYLSVLDTTVYQMPISVLTSLMKQQPEVGLVFADATLDRVNKLRKQLRRMLQESMDTALGRTLFELSSKTHDGRHVVDKRITQATIADFVGLSREQVNKVIKALRSQGVVDKTDEGYVVSDVFQDTGLSPLGPAEGHVYGPGPAGPASPLNFLLDDED